MSFCFWNSLSSFPFEHTHSFLYGQGAGANIETINWRSDGTERNRSTSIERSWEFDNSHQLQ